MERKAARIQTLVAEQAAEWVIHLEDATSAERAQFAQWLTASPGNVAELLNARATWEAMTGKALEHVPDTQTLLDMLRTDVPTPAPSRLPLPRGRRRMRMALAAGLALLAVGIGASVWVTRALDPRHAVYSTAVGEQVTRSLPDGSMVVLNTRTRLRLDWSDRYRDVHLDTGEALFEAARDPARPFRVWAGGTIIRAVGTQFNVYRAPEGVTVTVLEGRVAIDEPGAQAVHAQLTAGEQARIGPAMTVSTQRLTEPTRAVAWQTRRLIFEGEALSQVIAEFNRYNEKPLALDEPSLGTKRIHGVFDAKDRQSLIEFLETFEDLAIEERAGRLVLRHRAQR